MSEDRWKIRFKLERGDFTEADLGGEWGGTDVFVGVSMIREPITEGSRNGPASMRVFSRDGHTGTYPAPSGDRLLALTALAADISRDENATQWHRAYADLVVDLFRKFMDTVASAPEWQPPEGARLIDVEGLPRAWIWADDLSLRVRIDGGRDEWSSADQQAVDGVIDAAMAPFVGQKASPEALDLAALAMKGALLQLVASGLVRREALDA